MKMNNKSRKIAYFGLNVALAFVLSYFESLIPLNIGIPGIKLGLANLAVLTALYTLSAKDAFCISVIRIVLVGVTFGGISAMIYSLAGGLLSFAVMAASKKLLRLSPVGVSVLGAAAHNIGQLVAAGIIMRNLGALYYLPVLLVSGSVTGAAVGIVGGILIKRLGKTNPAKGD